MSALSASATGASYLILLQFLSRGLTFGVNQVLLRFLSPSLLGISTQLELYVISVLYFARESFRIAVQRQPAVQQSESPKEKVPQGLIDSQTPGGRTQSVVNIAYLSIYLGLPLAYGLGRVYILSTVPEVLDTPYFRESLNLYGVAAFWELLTEPCFVVVQQKLLYKIRAAAESAATIVRCGLTAAIAIYATRNGKDLGVLPFALGQMGYSFILLVVYYWRLWNISAYGGFSLSAQPLFSRDPSLYVLKYWSRPVLSLATSLYIQTGIKHVLTQGDALLMATFSTLADQGVYAVASNYGGLVARMLFQPIEESSRNLFSALLSSSKLEKQNMDIAASTLATLLRFYLVFCTIAVAIGPTIAPSLLALILGSRWTQYGAGAVLASYCYYIPLLALNGVTEAFISSVATSTELRIQSLWMFVFSGIFAASGFVFLQVLGWGAQGIVAANACNMLLRIAWSMRFIKAHLKSRGANLDLWGMIPSYGTFAAAGAATATMSGTSRTFDGTSWDLLKCTPIAGSTLLLIFYFERDFLMQCYRLLFAKGNTPKVESS